MRSDLIVLKCRVVALRLRLHHDLDGILRRIGITGRRRRVQVYGPVDGAITSLSQLLDELEAATVNDMVVQLGYGGRLQ